MLEDFCYEGIWWLPDDHEYKISGSLEFKAGHSITLRLSGIFRYKKGVYLKPEIILGRTKNNEKITLFETIETNWHRNFLSHEEPPETELLGDSTFVSNYVFVGEHFTNKDRINFHSIYISFTYLEQWLSPKAPLSLEFIEDGNVVKFKHLENYNIYINAINSTLSIHDSLGSDGDRWTNLNLTHISYLKITPENIKELEWHMKLVYNIENLLTLLIGSPVYAKALIAEGDEIQQFKERGISKRTEIKIYSILPDPKIRPEKYLWDMRSTFPKLVNYQNKDYLNIIINNWFDKQALLQPVCELFFSNYYNPSMYPHVCFLSLLQALEAFHRRIYGGKYLSDNEYKPICDTIVNAIPSSIEDSFRESLRNKIIYGNEFSLRKRLLEFTKTKKVSWFELTIGKDKKLVSKIVATRNYLTHYDDKSKKGIFEYGDILHMNEKLNALLSILLLEQIDTPTEILFDIVHYLHKTEDHREAIRSQE